MKNKVFKFRNGDTLYIKYTGISYNGKHSYEVLIEMKNYIGLGAYCESGIITKDRRKQFLILRHKYKLATDKTYRETYIRLNPGSEFWVWADDYLRQMKANFSTEYLQETFPKFTLNKTKFLVEK